MKDEIDYGFDASAVHPNKLRYQADQLEEQARNLRWRADETEAAMRRIEMEHAAKVPVDRANQQLTTGAPVPEDHSHTRLRRDGQQDGYVVLSSDERSKGFVRPFRDAYRHLKCGKITTMGRSIGETYARDPFFYSGTFCVHCGAHSPVGEDGEFTWYEMDGREGPKVGT
jgi:hypothetical protein